MQEINQTTSTSLVSAANKKGEVKTQNETIVIFTNNGSNLQKQEQKDYNVYGKDFANFSKFKGNDKHDAMRLTNTCANDVKRAYMQLQHEFPEIELEFEEMPDPQKCGKGREGFFTYQQQLSEWKDLALRKIETQREHSLKEVTEAEGEKTRSTVANATRATIANNNANTQAVINNQEETTEEIKEAVKKEGSATRNTVKKESDTIQNAAAEGEDITRAIVATEGAITRLANAEEHEVTRKTVKQEGEETRTTVEAEATSTRAHSTLNTVAIVETIQDEGARTRKEIDKKVNNPSRR